jgi:hypothetical protein
VASRGCAQGAGRLDETKHEMGMESREMCMEEPAGRVMRGPEKPVFGEKSILKIDPCLSGEAKERSGIWKDRVGRVVGPWVEQLWRGLRAGDWRRGGIETEVMKDASCHGGLGDERDDLHLAVALWAN